MRTFGVIAKRTVVSVAFFAAISGLMARAASAQVNTETLRKNIKARGISGSLNVALDGHTGNTEGIQADVSGGVGLETNRSLMFVYGSADYTRFNDVDSVNKNFIHARYVYNFTKWLEGEGFVQFASDQFQDLKLRSLFGLGPRFAVFNQKIDGNELDVFVGGAYMIERDIYEITEASEEARRDEVYARLNGYVAINYQMDTRINLVSTSYIQPRLEDWSDVRFLTEDGFLFTVAKRITAGITFSLHYDANPVAGVKVDRHGDQEHALVDFLSPRESAKVRAHVCDCQEARRPDHPRWVRRAAGEGRQRGSSGEDAADGRLAEGVSAFADLDVGSGRGAAAGADGQQRGRAPELRRRANCTNGHLAHRRRRCTTGRWRPTPSCTRW